LQTAAFGSIYEGKQNTTFLWQQPTQGSVTTKIRGYNAIPRRNNSQVRCKWAGTFMQQIASKIAVLTQLHCFQFNISDVSMTVCDAALHSADIL